MCVPESVGAEGVSPEVPRGHPRPRVPMAPGRACVPADARGCPRMRGSLKGCVSPGTPRGRGRDEGTQEIFREYFSGNRRRLREFYRVGAKAPCFAGKLGKRQVCDEADCDGCRHGGGWFDDFGGDVQSATG
jgi:hypothetical protein